MFLLEIMKYVLENDNIETPQLNYIALTPATIQHYYEHRSPQMMQWMSEMDTYLNVFNENECRYGLTSAHGTNYKLGVKGDLFIINIEEKMNECWDLYGKKLNLDLFSLFEYKIILQSKSMDMLYGLKDKLIFHTLGYMRNLKGIYSSIGHEESCLSLELPTERIGDVLLLGDIDTIFCDSNVNCKGN